MFLAANDEEQDDRRSSARDNLRKNVKEDRSQRLFGVKYDYDVSAIVKLPTG